MHRLHLLCEFASPKLLLLQEVVRGFWEEGGGRFEEESGMWAMEVIFVEEGTKKGGALV